MSGTLHIKLTPPERALLDQIELEALKLEGHAHWKSNSDLVVELFRSLSEREAIPEHRRKYFSDPAYNIGGRGSSVLDSFQRYGNRGEEIVRHPHFLAYLRYFLHGPDLPAGVIQRFQAAVTACGMVTSSDIIPLANLARQLVRGQRMEPRGSSEEFFKLALECGLSLSNADVVRRTVRRVRY